VQYISDFQRVFKQAFMTQEAVETLNGLKPNSSETTSFFSLNSNQVYRTQRPLTSRPFEKDKQLELISKQSSDISSRHFVSAGVEVQ